MRPCPNHPDAGDVEWFPVQWRRLCTGELVRAELPVCPLCLRDQAKRGHS